MNRYLLFPFLLACAVTAAGCGHSTGVSVDGATPAAFAASPSGRLTLTGSSTLAPLAMELARRFEQRYPDVRIDVQTGGSGQGIADARRGVADIGMASRRLLDDESDLTAHTIATDGVCLIVHGSNSVGELTSEQVIAIYTDRVNNWQQLGGPERAITVVHKAAGRATLDVFLQHFQLPNPQVKPDVIVGDNEHGVKTVAAAEGAIGYVSIGTAIADAETGVPIKLLAVGGIVPSLENVASGAFPMSRPLNFVTTETPSDLARAFIGFCQSAEVVDVVVSQHFVPVQQ